MLASGGAVSVGDDFECVLLSTPRSCAIRSRVMLQRTPGGVRATLPPTTLLPIAHMPTDLDAEVRTGGVSESRHLLKFTRFVGDGKLRAPVEQVIPSTRGLPSLKSPRRKLAENSTGAAGCAQLGVELATKGQPLLAQELYQKIKTVLNNLSGACHLDFKSHARYLRSFLQSVQELSESLNIPQPVRSYRAGCPTSMLHHVLQLLPAPLGYAPPMNAGASSHSLGGAAAEILPPAGGELSASGMQAFTVLLALAEIPWTFTYNGVTHHVCDCAQRFPAATASAAGGCLMPLEGLLDRLEHSGAGSARGPQSPAAQRAKDVRIDALRKVERHFPAKVTEHAKNLQDRFTSFTKQVPALLESFARIPEIPSAEQRVHADLAFRRFCENVYSELGLLEQRYTQFEQCYLGIVRRIIGAAQETVCTMAQPSCALLRARGDPFTPVDTAVLCQQLGFLKQQVKFDDRYNLDHFDPKLLVKARRVLQIDTFEEIKSSAREMLERFDTLCALLAVTHADQIQPELGQNAELGDAITSLEAVWSECQFTLQQGSLNFIKHLLAYLPTLSELHRYQIWCALDAPPERMRKASPRRVNTKRNILDADSVRTAITRVVFFETLPILMYFDELRAEVRPTDEYTRQFSATAFRDLFCSQHDERHHALRRDFSKFDDTRFGLFRAFLLNPGEEEEAAEAGHRSQRGAKMRQLRYFQLVYRQLKDIVAFPTNASPADVSPGEGEGYDGATAHSRACWVCVARVAQKVNPDIFPKEPPAVVQTPEEPVSEVSMGDTTGRPRRQSVGSSRSGALNEGRAGRERRRSSIAGGEAEKGRRKSSSRLDAGGSTAISREPSARQISR